MFHDAHGTLLPSFGAARERALEIVRKLGPPGEDLICTVRDMTGRPLIRVMIEAGKLVVSAEKS